MTQPRYWLMKSEPHVFSIDDLQKKGTAYWDGVRNYQARNFMRNDMQNGDLILIYHSSVIPPGVAGIATVSGKAIPDSTSWDPKSEYFDPASTPDSPRWFMVQIRFVEKFNQLIPLDHLRAIPELERMMLLRRGMRLSIQPVSKTEFETIVKIGAQKSRLAG